VSEPNVLVSDLSQPEKHSLLFFSRKLGLTLPHSLYDKSKLSPRDDYPPPRQLAPSARQVQSCRYQGEWFKLWGIETGGKLR